MQDQHAAFCKSELTTSAVMFTDLWVCVHLIMATNTLHSSMYTLLIDSHCNIYKSKVVFVLCCIVWSSCFDF